MSGAVAIVGAGIAGLRAAATLRENATVVVFEKSRGVGGRLATRRAGAFAFDHGAQYFRARDPEFAAFVANMEARGVVAPWRARFREFAGAAPGREGVWGEANAHYVGVGAMNAVGTAMAEGLDVRLSTRIVGARWESGGWRLSDEAGGAHGPFAALVVAIPSRQAADLLPEETPLRAVANGLPMNACFAMMLGYERAPTFSFDAALVTNSCLSFIAADHTKPGRSGAPSFVVLSDNLWADDHIDDNPADVEARLLDAFADIGGPFVHQATHRALHRWRFANCPPAPPNTPTLDGERRLVVCGDWLRQGRVEAAFLAGGEAGRAVARLL